MWPGTMDAVHNNVSYLKREKCVLAGDAMYDSYTEDCTYIGIV